jgi:pyrimidine-nucleoside phosphorylase
METMSEERMLDWITRKRNGERLAEEEIGALIDSYTRGDIPDHQMAAWLMAVFFRGMDPAETLALTRSMLQSGRQLDLSKLNRPKVDKHSTGGVGDKTSLVLAPLAAEAGVAVPMISGRSLGFTGGTLNKLESIPGFRVNLSIEEFQEVLEKVGCAIVGQTEELVPADRKIYALRDATATIECLPLIVASILSKKLAEDLDALVLDVKVGKGAFMTSLETALPLAQSMVDVANGFGARTCALITDMSQPLGFAIGNALEVAEAIETLRGGGPVDFRRLCEELATQMVLSAAPQDSPSKARAQISNLLGSGQALQRFSRMVEAQGGDPRIADRDDLLPHSAKRQVVIAQGAGYLAAVDVRSLAFASMNLGAGHGDPAAGLVVHKKIGDRIEKGEPLCTLHCSRSDIPAQLLSQIETAFDIRERKTEAPALIRQIIRHGSQAETETKSVERKNNEQR